MRDPGVVVRIELPEEGDERQNLVERVRERPGRVHLVYPDGTRRIADSATILPNGMTLSADGRHLYINASLEPAVRRFDVAGDGSLSGSTVITRPALRISADGEVTTDRVATDRKCLAVALGGDTSATLFLCTTVSNDEHESVAQRASRIEVTEVAISAAR